jgi:hypothetical protein
MGDLALVRRQASAARFQSADSGTRRRLHVRPGSDERVPASLICGCSLRGTLPTTRCFGSLDHPPDGASARSRPIGSVRETSPRQYAPVNVLLYFLATPNYLLRIDHSRAPNRPAEVSAARFFPARENAGFGHPKANSNGARNRIRFGSAISPLPAELRRH